MNPDFYRQFEDRFRGSREEILKRLTAYEPFITALDSGSFSRTALDLACGRGEWLEFVTTHGFTARGVDIDEGMIAACTERDLPADRLDALEALRAQPSDSLTVISGIHFIEHVPFDYVLEVAGEAVRALEPGGLLILETPNPENLLVGSELFYLDPSHQRPLPRALVAFAAESAGFLRTSELGLHGAAQKDGQTLYNVLRGVSQDYAVIAQKDGPDDVVARMDAPFEISSAATLAEIVEVYDSYTDKRDARVIRLDQVAEHAVERIENLEHEALQTAALIEQMRDDVRDLQLNLAVAQNRAVQAEAALDDMWHSRSWRVTKPLRASAGLMRNALKRAEVAPHRELPRAALRNVPLTPRGQEIYDHLSAEIRDATDR
jgi:SAM-dependent methyltransferase